MKINNRKLIQKGNVNETASLLWFGCWQIVADYPHRANYSYPTYYANRESLVEAIFEFASESISK